MDQLEGAEVRREGRSEICSGKAAKGSEFDEHRCHRRAHLCLCFVRGPMWGVSHVAVLA